MADLCSTCLTSVKHKSEDRASYLLEDPVDLGKDDLTFDVCKVISEESLHPNPESGDKRISSKSTIVDSDVLALRLLQGSMEGAKTLADTVDSEVNATKDGKRSKLFGVI